MLLVRRYTKKPVAIHAVKFDDTKIAEDLAYWCGGNYQVDSRSPSTTATITIPTLEGNMVANFGDYIIKGIKGEFYPCKPDIFEASYDPSA